MKSPAKPLFKQTFWPWLGATAIWMGLIFTFSAQTNSNELTQAAFGLFNFLVRKVAHLSEYAILAILARQTLAQLSFFSCNNNTLKTGTDSLPPQKQDIYGQPAAGLNTAAVSFSFLYAISDEWHQAFVPGRSAAYQDVLIDTGGAIIGIVLYTVILKIRSRKQSL